MNDSAKCEVRDEAAHSARGEPGRGGAALRTGEGSGGVGHWTAAVLLGAAGFLLNLLYVPISPGTDLLFGGVAYLLAAVAFGPAPGALAAAIASSRTIWLWNHPWAWLIFSLEGLMVGYLVTRWNRRLLTATALYWLLGGVPLLLLTYGWIMGISGLTATILFLKQPFNGLINALVVEGLLLLPWTRRLLGIPGAPRLRAALAVVVSMAAIIPALTIGIWEGRQRWEVSEERATERVQLFAQAHASSLEQYIMLHERAVRSVAEAPGRRGEFDPDQLQRLLGAELSQYPGFISLYAANTRGVAVAFEPPRGVAGEPLVGTDFSDRPYYRELRESESTVIAELYGERAGVAEPVVVIAHPVILADTFAGYVAGALDLNNLPAPSPAPASEERIRVADATGVLIYDSERRYRPGDRPRLVSDSIAFAAVRMVDSAGVVRYDASGGTPSPAAVTSRQVLAGVHHIPGLDWRVWVEHPFTRIEAAVARSYTRLMAVLLGIIVVSLLFSNLLARWLATPLLRVRAAAARLASGRLESRVGVLPTSAPGEVVEVGRGFDEMAEALERRTEELEALGEIARSLTSTLEVDDLLRQITDATTHLIETDGCGIALLEPDGESLRVSDYSLGLLAPAAGKRIPLEGSLSGWVMRTGKSTLLPGTRHEARLYHGAIGDTSRIRSMMAAPLIGRTGPLGALSAARSGEPSFTSDELRLLERLARHAALAVENARLYTAAQDASRAKTDFIATMSHELRTPLNAVLGHLQILQMGIHGELTPSQREALDRVEVASRHLRGLIEEVLSFARLEAGRAELRVVDADLRALAAEVTAVIEPLARAKGLDLRTDTARAPARVPTDADKVRQILINLAGNAVKFTERGEVWIRVRRRDDEVELAVGDTGPGISEAEQTRLFQPFEQLESGLSRTHGGTGLGLYLSSRYAAMLGGRIEVESEVGEGSVFSLVLPRNGPEAEAREYESAEVRK